MSRPTISIADLPPDWIAERRTIIERDGVAVQQGRGRSIEMKLTDHSNWATLTLPDNAFEFNTHAERDAVLRKLQGHKE